MVRPVVSDHFFRWTSLLCFLIRFTSHCLVLPTSDKNPLGDSMKQFLVSCIKKTVIFGGDASCAIKCQDTTRVSNYVLWNEGIYHCFGHTAISWIIASGKVIRKTPDSWVWVLYSTDWATSGPVYKWIVIFILWNFETMQKVKFLRKYHLPTDMRFFRNENGYVASHVRTDIHSN